jgi:hypothetical protein
LYGAGQKYWVDLWKQDGAWLLGRRSEGAAREWKIQLDKGLLGWAPSLWPTRLERLVPKLLPAVTTVRVFRNADRAPALPLWRPWLDSPVSGEAWRLILPTGPAQAVAAAYTSVWKGALPEHDVTAPAEAAALVRAVAEVLRLSADPRFTAANTDRQAAFDRYVAPTGLFRRDGLWFYSLTDNYARLFRTFLEAGFLLNPDSEAPGVIPHLSDGEWAVWAKTARLWQEENR